MPHELLVFAEFSDPRRFLFGSAGGFGALILTLVVPSLIVLRKIKTKPKRQSIRGAFFAVTAVLYVLAGGLAAVIGDAGDWKQALILGGALQSILGGVATAIQNATVIRLPEI